MGVWKGEGKNLVLGHVKSEPHRKNGYKYVPMGRTRERKRVLRKGGLSGGKGFRTVVRRGGVVTGNQEVCMPLEQRGSGPGHKGGYREKYLFPWVGTEGIVTLPE